MDNSNKKISRLSFLRRMLIGGAVVGVSVKASTKIVDAATVSDNLNQGGVIRSTTKPKASPSYLWLDLSDGGTMKYWDGTDWKPVRSTWG